MVSAGLGSPGSTVPVAARSRQDTGANLLQELEALSQALYTASKAQNVSGSAPMPSPRRGYRGHGGSVLQRRDTLDNSDVYQSQTGQQCRQCVSGNSSGPLCGHDQQDRRIRPGDSRSSIVGRSPSAAVSRLDDPLQLRSERSFPPRSERNLQPWDSKGLESRLSNATNYTESFEDQVSSSKKLEAPVEKKSIWNWQPFRTLSHIGHTRYSCVFTVQVHAIEGLSLAMNGLRLTVHLRHKDRNVQTMPSRVFQGSAEFEETLQLRCSVYSSKSNHHSVKFMPKPFTICVNALDVDELMLGHHRLDLSRLLPKSPDNQLEDSDKPLTWTTSFKLAGKAKGGTLVVTFSYELLLKEKGDRSGRFGLVIGSPSPSTGSPSLRSLSGSSYSMHGTPRPKTAEYDGFFSPVVSETGDYPDWLGMEHLNLNESPSDSSTSVDKNRKIGSRDQPEQLANGMPSREPKQGGFGWSQIERTLAQTARSQVEQLQELNRKSALANSYVNNASPYTTDARGDSDDEQEDFIVVDQGVEVSVLPDIIQYPEQRSENERNSFENESRKVSEELLNRPYEEKLGVVQQQSRGAKTFAGTGISLDKQELRKPVGAGVVKNNKEEGKVFDPLGRFQRSRQDEPLKSAQDLRAVAQSKDQDELLHGPNHQTNFYNIFVKEGRRSEPEARRSDPEGSRSEPAAQEKVGWEMSQPSYSSAGSRLEETKSKVSIEETVRREEALLFRPAHRDVDEGEMQRVHKSEGSLTSGVSTSHRNPTFDNLDDEIDLIAGDFLSMLDGAERGGLRIGMNSDNEIDSPRAQLLKEFEQEAVREGGNGLRLATAGVPDLNLNAMKSGRVDELGLTRQNWAKLGSLWQDSDDSETLSIMEAAESELQKAAQTMRSKTRAKMLEDAETEALMQEWGLNEKVFENSPVRSEPGFSDFTGPTMTKIPMELPLLAQGVGPVLQTKDGGTLRSMSPTLFSQSPANRKLVMQVSKPVVIPSETGTSGLDILKQLAMTGVEDMAVQAMVAMPLEDITGKSVHQIAYESKVALEVSKFAQNQFPPSRENYGDSVLTSRANSRGVGVSLSSANPSDEFIGPKELAPTAMQQIEALAMDGLKIQADLLDDCPPNNADSQGVAAIHLPYSKVGGLMSKLITIDEWISRDAGLFDGKHPMEKSKATLTANGVMETGVVAMGTKEARIRQLQSFKETENAHNLGFMGNTLTIAMLVQLRDPLRNNEPVGAPMMALVQAERLIVPPRLKISRRAPSPYVSSEVGADEEENSVQNEPVQQFKITAVHMSGFKASEEQGTKKKTWGSQKQQQLASRWLTAYGMGKVATADSKFSTNPIKTKGKSGESLWSISAHVHGFRSKWKEATGMNSHIRNPDVVFGG